MAMDATEASRALDEIEAVRGRMAELKYYRNAAPYFITWGVVWLIGNASVELVPAPVSSWIWAGLIPAGVAASFWFGIRQGARSRREGSETELRKGKRTWLRSMAIGALIFAFILAVAWIFGPTDARRMGAFMALTAGFAYMAAGLAAWAWRVFALGVVVAVLTMGGYLWVEEHFFLWMSVVGGGSLIVGGLLVRKA
jgi:hypothetical protein